MRMVSERVEFFSGQWQTPQWICSTVLEYLLEQSICQHWQMLRRRIRKLNDPQSISQRC